MSLGINMMYTLVARRPHRPSLCKAHLNVSVSMLPVYICVSHSHQLERTSVISAVLRVLSRPD